MPNPADWRPALRTAAGYSHEIDQWLAQVAAWGAPLLLPAPSPEDGLLWESAEAIARRMVATVSRSNAMAWRVRVSRGTSATTARRIFAALKTEMRGVVGLRVRELITSNTKLIVGMPDLLAQQTSIFVARQQRKGIRASAIAQELSKRLPLQRQRTVRMLARTEVARAETALTQSRSEGLGLNWYEWATSEDARVRPSHRNMDKVLVAWNDAPSPEALVGETSEGFYPPGGTYNCRCLALPLVDLDEVSWPHRVYAHGHVMRLGRREFERFAGLPAAA